MAVVQGVKEKVHLPIYDSIKVDPEKQLSDIETSSTLKFFIDVQGKTKLETNLQSAGLLPHYNTFEARAMRVVISDLPPEFPDDPTAKTEGHDVTDDDDKPLGAGVDAKGNAYGGESAAGPPPPLNPPVTLFTQVSADVELTLADLIDQIHAAEDDLNNTVDIPVDDSSVTVTTTIAGLTTDEIVGALADAGGKVTLSLSDLQDLLNSEDIPADQQPLDEQIYKSNGFGTLLGKVVYNTVTTFYVGEKIMIQMPTWFFPAGAGPYSESATVVTHGEPSPLATFRFAEPIYIDKQQNFRVEIEIPDSDVLKELQRIYGPFFIWVVLDGYMTRDVQ
jgi:hypothetical protein